MKNLPAGRTEYILDGSNPSVQTKKQPSGKEDILQQYLHDIADYDLLDQDETHELFLHINRSGDEEALQRLQVANQRLVVKIALAYLNYSAHSLTDYIQEGNIGLMMAIRKFDPHRGIQFSTYASYWIKSYILKFIQDNWRPVKICTTQNMRNLFFSLNREKLAMQLAGQNPDTKTISRRLNLGENQIIDAEKRLNCSDIPLEKPVSSDSDTTFGDMLPHQGESTEEMLIKKDLKEKINTILAREDNNFNPREKTILWERLFTDTPQTLKSISDRFNISKERVRQIEKALLTRLRITFEREMPDLIPV